MHLLRKFCFAAAAAWLLLLAFATESAAQTRPVQGRVLDETDTPVAGAFITVKGESRGVMTDDAGRFDINVKSSDVLIVSFLGYEDEEVTVGTQDNIPVKLTPQKNQLEEVVMVAYGAQKKASVIGSITTADVQQLAAPIGQLSTGLAGKLADIVAVQKTGEPGSSADFWIRGVNTFGANATPLTAWSVPWIWSTRKTSHRSPS